MCHGHFSPSSAFLTFGGSVPRDTNKDNNSSILVVTEHRPNPDNPEQIIQSHSIIQVDSSLRRRVGGGRGRGGPIIGGGIPPPPAIVPKRRVVEEPPMLPSGGGDATTTTGNMTPEQASRQFDIHRREATKLERQLEDRVARYQQVRTTRVLVPLPYLTTTSRIYSIKLVCRVCVCVGSLEFVLYSFATPPLAHPCDLPIFDPYLYIYANCCSHFRTPHLYKNTIHTHQYVYIKPPIEKNNIKKRNTNQLAQRFGDGSFSSGGGNNGGGGPSDNDNYAQRGSLLAVDYGVGGSTITNGTTNNSSTTATALDKLDDEESALSDDIQRTISRMNELINIKMGPMSERTDRAQHVLLVKRYREIVFDCNAEFGRTRAGIARRREARELFSNATAAGGGLGGGNEAERQLLRERNAIDNSMNGASDALNQAAHVRAELRTQGSNLRGIAGTMGRIASRVPGLNAIIDKIRKKRLQDDRVVGGVVAMCILFTLWYLFG